GQRSSGGMGRAPHLAGGPDPGLYGQPEGDAAHRAQHGDGVGGGASMTWLAWRQHRLAAVVLFTLAVAVAGLIVWSGVQILALEKVTQFCHAPCSMDVMESEVRYLNLVNAYRPWVEYTAFIGPLVVGLFLGA